MGLIDYGFGFEKRWVLLNFLVFLGWGLLSLSLGLWVFSVYGNCDLWVFSMYVNLEFFGQAFFKGR